MCKRLWPVVKSRGMQSYVVANVSVRALGWVTLSFVDTLLRACGISTLELFSVVGFFFNCTNLFSVSDCVRDFKPYTVENFYHGSLPGFVRGILLCVKRELLSLDIGLQTLLKGA